MGAAPPPPKHAPNFYATDAHLDEALELADKLAGSPGPRELLRKTSNLLTRLVEEVRHQQRCYDVREEELKPLCDELKTLRVKMVEMTTSFHEVERIAHDIPTVWCGSHAPVAKE